MTSSTCCCLMILKSLSVYCGSGGGVISAGRLFLAFLLRKNIRPRAPRAPIMTTYACSGNDGRLCLIDSTETFGSGSPTSPNATPLPSGKMNPSGSSTSGGSGSVSGVGVPDSSPGMSYWSCAFRSSGVNSSLHFTVRERQAEQREGFFVVASLGIHSLPQTMQCATRALSVDSIFLLFHPGEGAAGGDIMGGHCGIYPTVLSLYNPLC